MIYSLIYIASLFLVYALLYYLKVGFTEWLGSPANLFGNFAVLMLSWGLALYCHCLFVEYMTSNTSYKRQEIYRPSLYAFLLAFGLLGFAAFGFAFR